MNSEAVHEAGAFSANAGRTLIPLSVSRRHLLAGAAVSALGLSVGGDLLHPASARATPCVQYQFPIKEQWTIPTDGGWGNEASWRSRPHAGADFIYTLKSSQGQDFFCVADGVVHTAMTTRDNNWGYYVIVSHADGKYSFYGHMTVATGLTVGASIARGAKIGTIGNWVNGAAGAWHLHLGLADTAAGVFTYATTVDPISYINQHKNPCGSGTGNGGNNTPKDEDELTYYIATNTSSNGWVGQGGIYVQGADGPLRGLGIDEWGARAYFGAVAGQWTGDMIATLISRVGLRATDTNGRLTGAIVFGP